LGSACAAEMKESTDFTTPLDFKSRPICAIVSPCSTANSTLP
jgi:hypothetical protein